jgi:alpha-L-fucosidase
MLSDMGQWMKTNGEGIYGSKAWKTWGEGELISDPKKPEKAPVLRVFPGGGLSKFHAAFRYETSDFRFTEGNNGALYVWALRIPEQKTTFKIKSLGTQSEYCQSKIKSVRLLGYTQKLKWKQKPDGLYVEFPAGSNLKYSAGLKVELEK